MENGVFDLDAVTLLAGEARTDITRGASDGDYITIAPLGDEGGVVLGANGDTMLFKRRMNGYTMTLVYLSTASSIGTLGILRALGSSFPIFYSFGGSEFAGAAVLQNRGDETVSSSGGPRTIVLAVSKSTDILAGQGTVVQTGS